MKKVFFTILLLITTIDLSSACSCGTYLLDLPIKEMGWTQSESAKISSISDVIFTGTLIKSYPITEERLGNNNKKELDHKYELIFKLIKSYKGASADTIIIRTNHGSAACGFHAPISTDCIIFAAKQANGLYYTYRSDCCKSISADQDVKRYNKYVDFLESITNMIDGNYSFKQARSYWDMGNPNKLDTLDLISYQIKNGKFEGTWKVTDRRGEVLEVGEYENGLKVGLWKVVSLYDTDNLFGGTTTKTELITYKEGKPVRGFINIEETKMNYESGENEIIRTEKIIKEYDDE